MAYRKLKLIFGLFAILILVIIILYPNVGADLNDIIILAGHEFLSIACFGVILVILSPEERTSAKEIKMAFAQMHSPQVIYQATDNPEFNYLRLDVNKHDIAISTDPIQLNENFNRFFKYLIIAGLMGPLIATAVLAVRALYLPVEQFLVIFDLIIVYGGFFLFFLILKYSNSKILQLETKRLFYCVKKDSVIKISVRLSERFIGKNIHNQIQTIEIPQSQFSEEIYVRSLDQIQDEVADQIPVVIRIVQKLTRLIKRYPISICVDLDSPNIKVIQSAQYKDKVKSPLSSTFLLFGLLDKEAFAEFHVQLLNWVNDSKCRVQPSVVIE